MKEGAETRRALGLSYFEQKERRADVEQDVEVFCCSGTVQRTPVSWEGELQQET